MFRESKLPPVLPAPVSMCEMLPYLSVEMTDRMPHLPELRTVACTLLTLLLCPATASTVLAPSCDEVILVLASC